MLFISAYGGPSSGSHGNSKRLGEHSSKDLIDFGDKCLRALQEHPEVNVVLDGLVRVDIMLSNEGKLVVNEFEGMEAVYFSTNSGREYDTDHFLQQYWERKIYDCICNLFSS